VDGVWTDGTFYKGTDNMEFKRFTVLDGVGMAMARAANLKIALISGRYSPATEYRAMELKIEDVYNGSLNKIPAYEELKEKYNYPLYIDTATGKNSKKRIINAIEKLDGVLAMIMSVQSMTPTVLKNIKRDNKYDFFIVSNIYVINDVYVLLEKIEFQLINFFLIPAEYHQDSDTKVTYIQKRI
jgi:hypothetical protein